MKMYCNCTVKGFYHDRNNFRQVEVDSEGICKDCGHYAVKNKVYQNDSHVESRIDTEEDFNKSLRYQDSTVKDYVNGELDENS